MSPRVGKGTATALAFLSPEESSLWFVSLLYAWCDTDTELPV